MQNSPKAFSIVALVALGSIILFCALFFAHQARMLRIAVPACALLVAVTLYERNRSAYLQFTLWTWFLCPLLRRLIDWRFGYAEQNLTLLAPILVTAVAGLCLVNDSRRLREATPFLFCISGVLYGFVIGVIRHPSADVVYGLFTWLAPVVFGLNLFLQWPMYEDRKQAIERTLLLGVLVMGAYGIYQYCDPPPWDVYWWQSLPSGTPESFGRPVKYEVRVWSTFSAPAPFAGVMCVGLLMNWVSGSKAKFLCNLAGLGALLLSMSRTEWLACAIGLVFIVYRGGRAMIAKTLIGLALVVAISISLVGTGPAQKMIATRVQSFQHLTQDDSYQTRAAMYERLSGDVLREPFGRGVSNATTYDGYALDSGPLRFLLNLGVLGTAFYLLGLSQILMRLAPRSWSTDPVPTACAAVLIAACAKFISLSTFENGPGTMVWLCIGMGMAARHYYALPVRADLSGESYVYSS